VRDCDLRILKQTDSVFALSLYLKYQQCG